VPRYVANRFLTLVENSLIDAKLLEYHTGYRALARTLLERLPIEKNSDDFVFDNQMLANHQARQQDRRGDLPSQICPKARQLTSEEVCVRGRLSGNRVAFSSGTAGNGKAANR
jgi:hypothetical protein